MDPGDTDVEMSRCWNAHRVERGGRLKGNGNICRAGGDYRHHRDVSLRPRISHGHARLRMNRRQVFEHAHLLVAETRRHPQLLAILENLAQMRRRLARAEDYLRHAGARLAIMVPPDLSHDATRGRDTLPLCSPPRSRATNLKPTFLQARRSSPRHGSLVTRSNISGATSMRTTESC